jgi:hypothetical protein
LAFVPAAGVPASVAVLSPLSVRVTPEGSAADFVHPLELLLVIVLVGAPVVVIVKVPAEPIVNVVALALWNAGACPVTVNVNGDAV